MDIQHGRGRLHPQGRTFDDIGGDSGVLETYFDDIDGVNKGHSNHRSRASHAHLSQETRGSSGGGRGSRQGCFASSIHGGWW